MSFDYLDSMGSGDQGNLATWSQHRIGLMRAWDISSEPNDLSGDLGDFRWTIDWYLGSASGNAPRDHDYDVNRQALPIGISVPRRWHKLDTRLPRRHGAKVPGRRCASGGRVAGR